MYSFRDFGLNPFRNFLQAPVCEDCGKVMTLSLKDRHDVVDFCVEMLDEHGCAESAIFVKHHDRTMEVVFGVIGENDDRMKFGYLPFDAECELFHPDSFAEIDGECRLCCYGILVETEPGQYLIVED